MFSGWRAPLVAITLMSGSLLVLAVGTANAALRNYYCNAGPS